MRKLYLELKVNAIVEAEENVDTQLLIEDLSESMQIMPSIANGELREISIEDYEVIDSK